MALFEGPLMLALGDLVHDTGVRRSSHAIAVFSIAVVVQAFGVMVEVVLTDNVAGDCEVAVNRKVTASGCSRGHEFVDLMDHAANLEVDGLLRIFQESSDLVFCFCCVEA
jgi:hypothetical protein